jgi:hypothetical protein
MVRLLTTCFHASFFPGLFFDPEDGGDMFLRNVGLLATDCKALYPRRVLFSWRVTRHFHVDFGSLVCIGKETEELTGDWSAALPIFGCKNSVKPENENSAGRPPRFELVPYGYEVWNGNTTTESRIGKDLQGSGRHLIWSLIPEFI